MIMKMMSCLYGSKRTVRTKERRLSDLLLKPCTINYHIRLRRPKTAPHQTAWPHRNQFAYLVELQINLYRGQVTPVHKSTRTQSSLTAVKSYPCLGQLISVLMATLSALHLLVMSLVYDAYIIIYCLYCFSAISSFSKRNYGICCHLPHIQTDVML